MSEKIKPIGVRDGLAIKRIARENKLPVHGVEVFRKYDALDPEVQGYLANVPLFGPKVPGVAIITDPQLAARLLREEEFKAFDNHTPIHNANGPLRGAFILGQYKKDSWLEDKRAATPEYSPSAMRALHKKIQNGAQDAFSKVLDNKHGDALPQSWIKYLLTYQLTNLLVGEPLDHATLTDAIEAHSKYTGNTLRSLTLGNTGRIGGYFAKTMLIPYETMLDQMEQKVKDGNGEGLLPHVLKHVPEGKYPEREVMSTLIGGQSLLKASVNSTLLMLARHPEIQEALREDDEALRNAIIETGRMYPPSLYNVRRTIAPMTIGEEEMAPNSLIIFASFAYGGEKNVANASQFNPERPDLKKMISTHGGAANIFGNGPHICLGKHLSPAIVEATVRTIVNQFHISSENNPAPILGGVGLRFQEPIQLRLTDRETNTQLIATTK